MTSVRKQMPLVAGRHLRLSFGPRVVLDDVDLDLHPGQSVALTGRSGSGKTSLLLVLAGLVVPTAGAVTWPGLSTDPHQRRHQIGMVFQSPSLMPELTVAENVALPQRLRGVDVDSSRRATAAALELVGVADLRDALPAQLSGGQQQRVAIARVVAGHHRLVLADEPTGSLDRDHARSVLDILAGSVAESGGAMIIATHDDELAFLVPEHVRMIESERGTTSAHVVSSRSSA